MEQSSGSQLGVALGAIIALVAIGFFAFAILSIIMAFVKRNAGWMVAAALCSVLACLGVGTVGVASIKSFQRTFSRTSQQQQVVVSSDGWISLRVPGDWRRLPELNAEATLKVGNKRKEQYALVLSERDADIRGSLQDFTRVTTVAMRDKLKGGELQMLRQTKINGFDAMQTKITGAADLVRISYLHTTVKTPGGFHQIIQWTLPSKEAAAFPVFEKVASSFAVVQPRVSASAQKRMKREGSVEERVHAVIASQLSVPIERLQPQTTLADDLGADEVDEIELIMALEEEFSIDISDEDERTLKTVGDLVRHIENHAEPLES